MSQLGSFSSVLSNVPVSINMDGVDQKPWRTQSNCLWNSPPRSLLDLLASCHPLLSVGIWQRTSRGRRERVSWGFGLRGVPYRLQDASLGYPSTRPADFADYKPRYKLIGIVARACYCTCTCFTCARREIDKGHAPRARLATFFNAPLPLPLHCPFLLPPPSSVPIHVRPFLHGYKARVINGILSLSLSFLSFAIGDGRTD